MTRNNCNTDDCIYDTTTGWKADPGTGLNLVNGKTAAQPVDDKRITTLKQDATERYDTDTATGTGQNRSVPVRAGFSAVSTLQRAFLYGS